MIPSNIPPSPYHPPDGPLQIHWIDAHLLVVDKPAGLLAVPGKGPDLAECLQSRLEQLYPGVLLVHRLDRDTSGLMVFARTKAAQRHLGLQFERRHVKKTYLARVAGAPDADSGEVNLPLRADWPNRPKQMVDQENGKPALTAWRVLERGESSLLELRPLTGRSHQLRVHCLSLGLPILGDPFYAEGAIREAGRLMLHASQLSFFHPEGGAEVQVTSPRPFF